MLGRVLTGFSWMEVVPASTASAMTAPEMTRNRKVCSTDCLPAAGFAFEQVRNRAAISQVSCWDIAPAAGCPVAAHASGCLRLFYTRGDRTIRPSPHLANSAARQRLVDVDDVRGQREPHSRCETLTMHRGFRFTLMALLLGISAVAFRGPARAADKVRLENLLPQM